MTRRRIDTHGFRNIAIFSAIFGVGAWVLVMMGAAGVVETLERLGLRCESCWTGLWNIALLLGLVSPVPFVRFIRKHYLDFDRVHKRLILFNVVEYSCLTIAFLPIFVSSDTLCNSGDGQVALLVVFAGWIANSVLFLINRITERLLKRLRMPIGN